MKKAKSLSETERSIGEYTKRKRNASLEVAIVLWAIEHKKHKFALRGFGGKLIQDG